MDWTFWLMLTIILSLIEIFTVNLVSIWFVISGIFTMILSLFIKDSAIISTFFVIFGVILLFITRPIVAKLRSKENAKTNLERIIGENAIVTEDIKNNNIGEVKVDGKKWSATSKEKCLKGEIVKVLKIDGVKLIVKKEE